MNIFKRIFSSIKEVDKIKKKENGWTYIETAPPDWLLKAVFRAMRKYPKSNGYGRVYFFKGKNNIYKAVVGWPKSQGNNPIDFYKKNRNKKSTRTSSQSLRLRPRGIS
ncbi:MAG: hypothetical protein WA139_00190 [Candidatus Aenigmatarchaeota archaeon]